MAFLDRRVICNIILLVSFLFLGISTTYGEQYYALLVGIED